MVPWSDDDRESDHDYVVDLETSSLSEGEPDEGDPVVAGSHQKHYRSLGDEPVWTTNRENTAPLSPICVRQQLLTTRSEETETSAVRSTAATSSSSSNNNIRRVRFATTVQIREHAVTVGDHSHIAFPLTLDWKHVQSSISRPLAPAAQDRSGFLPPSRNNKLQSLDIGERQIRLQAMGIAKNDILRMERTRRILLWQQWAFAYEPTKRPANHTGSFFMVNYALN